MLNEITAKSILRKHNKIDSWFVSAYAVNLYRGCTHNCVYCDGRDEKYQVEGEFGRDISVKVNAIDLLTRELDPTRKRTPFSGGFFIVCGGVSDSYQPFESDKMICRQTLELFYRFRHPVHILTKSTLVERDIDILQKINKQNRAVVSFSFSSTDNNISKLLEPGVPLPEKRLQTIRRFKDAGISCGMYLMPVIPFITDSPDIIEHTVMQAKDAGVDFIIFSGLTLKPGRQKEHFVNFLKKQFPQLLANYEQLYGANNPWGGAQMDYYTTIEKRFSESAKKYSMPKRMPSRHFENIVSKSELILLILEQLDYLAKQGGKASPFGYAAYSLSLIKKPIESMCDKELLNVKGIGPFTVKLIREIIETGRCEYYENLL
jgi:DNA repair photolyase